ncbi:MULTISPECIES: GNAT family N-acetyltransferase [Streptomyces]|uniref:GNAT family N-acetyltransferase n=1 Tax=Streptomyces TaxID=1883 RepID=UPI000C27F61C|nr:MULTISPECIES: GNAT family N-acetyltransferase [Streptomyces]MBP0936818.1 GNAT family N-acetyltransferase [Streptomyces sp. KCTC 0041BP]PJN15176.1 GNAT family N-acetyltransferase [Streptomyces sp. CB02120-2]GHD60716.1 N-acetyltransferase [Streptomyces goshikiensis]
MTWTFTSDLASYQAAAGPAVAAEPVTNTLLLSVADALARRGPQAFGPGPAPFFGWWTGADGSVAGGVVCTPPFPLTLGALPPEAVRALGAALGTEPLLSGVGAVNARRPEAELLAGAWGRPWETAEETRLYRLDGLLAPDPAPQGRARRAVPADLPLLLEWTVAFKREAGVRGAASEAALRDRLSYGGLLLWEHAGEPVSLAGFTRPIGSASRVGPVYTPPGRRGRGFAAGVTYAVSGAARAAGAREVLLFTDLANPTSNGVYRRLGYAPVEDRVEVVAVG